MATAEEIVAELTPEQAIAELLKDRRFIEELSWSFLLGIAANGLFMKGTAPSEIHAMIDIAFSTGVLDEGLPPWVFLLALATKRWRDVGGTLEIMHQAVDTGLRQVIGGGQA
jgi:hypothetical protein